MDFDFNEWLENVKETMEDYWEKTQQYFSSLTTYEIIAWAGEGVGLVLVILAFILW